MNTASHLSYGPKLDGKQKKHMHQAKRGECKVGNSPLKRGYAAMQVDLGANSKGVHSGGDAHSRIESVYV